MASWVIQVQKGSVREKIPPKKTPNKRTTTQPWFIPCSTFYLFFFVGLVEDLTDLLTSVFFSTYCIYLRYTFCKDRIYKCKLAVCKNHFLIQFSAIKCNQKVPSILLELSSKCNLIQFTFPLVFKFLTAGTDISQSSWACNRCLFHSLLCSSLVNSWVWRSREPDPLSDGQF